MSRITKSGKLPEGQSSLVLVLACLVHLTGFHTETVFKYLRERTSKLDLEIL